MQAQFAETNKFFKVPQRKKEEPGMFGIFIDPTKCKGCAECVEACEDLGYNALKMIEKEDTTVPIYQKSINFFRSLPATPQKFINDRVAVDMMLGRRKYALCGRSRFLRRLRRSDRHSHVAGRSGLQVRRREFGDCGLHRL